MSFSDHFVEGLHEQVRDTLLDAIESRKERARELYEEMKALEIEARRIEKAVEEERWYDLEAYLNDFQIEVLCECSPKDLLNENPLPPPDDDYDFFAKF